MAECDPSTRHKLQKTRHDFGRSAFIEPTRFQSSFTRLKKDLYNDDPFRVSLLCRNMYERHYYSKRKSVTSIPKERGDGVASSRSTDDDVKASHAPAPSSMDAAPQPAQPAQPALDNALDDIMDQLSGLSLSVKEQRQRSIQKQIDRRDHVIAARRAAVDLYDSYTLTDESYDDLLAETIIEKPSAVRALTKEEDEVVRKYMTSKEQGQIAVYKTAIVEYKDIHKLAPDTWLNDEIINFYMQLIADRADANVGRLPSVHCYSTFFCSTLRDSGYAKVRRWTKRVDVFAKDLLFIPINYSYHWTLGVVDVQAKTIRVYDSLGGSHGLTLQLLLQYLKDEHKDKKGTEGDFTGWTLDAPKGIPHQENMSDCGVFTCTFAERLAQRQRFDFAQKDMVNIRKRMVLSIVNKAINT